MYRTRSDLYFGNVINRRFHYFCRKREIVKRLQRSKPTTKQFVKHLLRKVYSELKSKKRKLSSIDKFLSTNHVYSKNSKKNSVRSAPTILILSKACQEPKDVLLSRKLNFTADCEIRNRMKNKTELMKHAENFAKRARNSTGYVEKYVCLGKIQAHACHELSGITHCLECVYPYRVSSDYCRFMDFRKIHKNLPTNKLESHGFIDYPSYAKYSLVDKNKTLFNEFLPRRRLVENDDKWSQRLACYVIRCLVDQYKLLLAREEKILNDCSKWKLTGSK
uniref:Uncharacterized protein n=1 Tax=Romanomermis culicivorax TaxID=13658 RepID=A0A915HKG3_ROMCU